MTRCFAHARCWTYEGVHHDLDHVSVVWSPEFREYGAVYVHSARCTPCKETT